LVARIGHKLGGEAKIRKTVALAKRWGGPGIFFSRWLVTSIGPWLNVTSGIAEYPWRRFIIWDVLGDLLWVVLNVMLGYIFSDRVQAIADVFGISPGSPRYYCRGHLRLENNLIPALARRSYP
jgi:membrane protein DedA with SNARE-associated domain